MSSTTTRTNQEIAAQIARSAAENDVSLFRDVLAPDAVWWHAIGDHVATVDDSLAYFQAILDVTIGLHYEDVRVSSTETGYVDQHSVVGTLSNGTEINIPAVMIAAVKDGVVTRLDEYVESLAAGPIATAVAERLRG